MEPIAPQALVRKRKRYCFFQLNKIPTNPMLYFSERYDVPIITQVRDLRQYDVALFSLLSYRDFWKLAALHRDKPSGQEWIGGGNAVTNPTGIKHVLDYCYIGQCWTNFPKILQGERDFPSMLDCRNAPDAEVTYFDEPMYGSNYVKNEIQLSTGCRRKCLFCTNTFREPYREQPKENVFEYLERHRKENPDRKAIYLASNSTNDVSYYSEVERKLMELNLVDRSLSNAIQGVTDQFIEMRSQVSDFGEVLIGVEGMSERVRWYINKPISRDLLRDTLIRALKKRLPVRTCHQFNLPGEDMHDWLEFRDILDEMRSLFSGTGADRAHGWCIPFIPNHISAQTPFQWLPLKYDPKRAQLIVRTRQQLLHQRQDGLVIILPNPRGSAMWFDEILTEWFPVTPRLMLACKGAKTYEEPAYYVDRLKKRTGGEIDASFLLEERPEHFNFPWDHVNVATSKPDLYRFFSRMKRKIEKGGPSTRNRGDLIQRRATGTSTMESTFNRPERSAYSG